MMIEYDLLIAGVFWGSLLCFVIAYYKHLNRKIKTLEKTLTHKDVFINDKVSDLEENFDKFASKFVWHSITAPKNKEEIFQQFYRGEPYVERFISNNSRHYYDCSSGTFFINKSTGEIKVYTNSTTQKTIEKFVGVNVVNEDDENDVNCGDKDDK